jgi:hypothetical protein
MEAEKKTRTEDKKPETGPCQVTRKYAGQASAEELVLSLIRAHSAAG